MRNNIKDLMKNETEENQLLTLVYVHMTRSDLKGYFEDDYYVSVIYAMRCIDIYRKDYDIFKANETAAAGVLLLKIYESSELINMPYISFDSWAWALHQYMYDNLLELKDVQEEDRFKLVNILKKYLEDDIYENNSVL